VFDAPTDPALIQRYAAAGVTRCVFTIPSNDAEQFGATLACLQEQIEVLSSHLLSGEPELYRILL
jgi:hypothetical protein